MRSILIAAVVTVALAGCATSGASPDQTQDPTPTAVAVADVPADPNEALTVAIQSGDTAAVDAALDRGADPSLGLGEGTTALMAAIRHQDSAMVEALLAAGADTSPADRSGYTALHRAAELGTGEMVSALIQAGASNDVFTTDAYAMAPIHTAAYHNNVEALEAFLIAGVDPNTPNESFNATALHWAAFQNSVEAIQVLVLYGADTTLTQSAGLTALEVAVESGNVEAATALEAIG